MTAIYGADDGIHPVNGVQAFKAEMLLAQLGLGSPVLGYGTVPVNDRSRASRLGSDTEFGGSVFKMTFSHGASGYDWSALVERSWNVKSNAGTVIAQFSSNHVVVPNFLPSEMKLGGAAVDHSYRITTFGGRETFELREAGNTNGFMDLRAGLITLASYTKAELNAIGANTVPRAMAWCSDATGGAGFVVSNGSSATTGWRRVDDGSAGTT